MRIKRTIDPWNEGSMKEIYRLFFAKLTYMKPHEMSLQAFHEELFDTKNRDIVMYDVMKPFKMPGLYLVAPNVKIQGIGYRDIPTKTVVYVRTDSRVDTVEVEAFAGPGKRAQVFSLTLNEWDFVQKHLRTFDRKGKLHRKEYYGGR